MSCHVCGANAPTENVAFHQNIGMVIMRQTKHVEGDLCRRCIDSHFWPFTVTTLLIGWLGVISLFIAPIYIVINVYHFARTRSLADEHAPGVGASLRSAPPQSVTLGEEARAKLAPFEPELRARLSAGEDFADVAFSVARKAGVSAAQAEAFATTLEDVG